MRPCLVGHRLGLYVGRVLYVPEAHLRLVLKPTLSARCLVIPMMLPRRYHVDSFQLIYLTVHLTYRRLLGRWVVVRVNWESANL